MNVNDEAPKGQKAGSPNKCPSCGDALPAFASVCKSCGHELANVEVNRSLASLTQRFEEIEREIDGKGIVDRARQKAILERKAQVIRDFPIPNAREDLQQLLYFIQPKLLASVKPDPNVEDWRVKFAEVLNRARRAYRDDAKTLAEFEDLERSLQTTVTGDLALKAKRSPVVAILLGVCVLAALGVAGVLHHQKATSADCESAFEKGAVAERTRLDKLFAQVDAEIRGRSYTEAELHSGQLRWEFDASCRQDESAKSKALWDQKRAEIVALIKTGQGALEAETRAAEEKVAAARNEEQAKVAGQERAQAEKVQKQEAKAATDARKASAESQF